MAEGKPFVGRTDELAELDRCLRAADDGELSIVVIEGDAGIGKSRLLGELARRAALANARVLRGAGHEAASVPFLPVVAALSPIVDLGTPTAAIADLDAGLAPKFAAASDAIVTAAADRPIVLCLDDVHWFDEPSCELLAHLLSALVHQASIGPVRALVAVATRPSVDMPHVRRVLSTIAREPMAHRVQLSGLDLFDFTAVVEQSLHAAPDKAFLYALFDAAKGNPLMAGAIIERLEAFGALREREGLVTTTSAAELTALPHELAEMLRLRLERVPAACARLLTTAAFLGDDSTVDELRTATALDDDVLHALLDEAIRARLIDVAAERFRFEHPLIGQVLYHQPVGRRRQELHRTIADRLEAGASDPHAPDVALALARHLRSAGPDVDRDRLVQVSLIAGNHAAAIGAWAEATRCFTTVIEASDDRGAFTALLERRLANACFHCHQFAVGKVHADRAVERGRALGDLRLWGESLLVTVNLAAATTEGRGQLLEVEPMLEFVATAENTEPALAARVHAAIAQVHSTADDHAAARRHVDRSRELASESGDPATIAAVEQGAGIHHLFALELGDALRAFTRSQEAADETEDRSARAWPVTRAGLVHLLRGESAAADERLREGQVRARAGWMWQELSYGTALRGALAAITDDHQAARHHAEAALRLHRWNSVWLTPGIAYPTMVALDLASRDFERAAATLAEWHEVGGRSVRRYELLLTAARDGADAARELHDDRPVRVPTAVTVTTADAIVVHGALAEAMASSAAAAEAVPLLRALREERGVRFVPGWPASTARLLGSCLALLGDHESAADAFALATTDAGEAGALRERAAVPDAHARGGC